MGKLVSVSELRNMRHRATFALAAFAAFAVQWPVPATAQGAVPPEDASSGPQPVSEAVTTVAGWVLASRDSGGLPYIVIDKVGAELFVFDGQGQLIGRAPALLGSAKGDESVPGVGDRELSRIPPADRTTPAGRFVARFGPAAGRQKVLWVDFSSAVSLHAVVTGNRKEHRLERLRSPTPEDNRITYGCINVPKVFYDEVVRPLLTDSGGIVYILPEARPLAEVFWAAQPKASTASP